MTDWIKIQEEYETTSITLKALAEKHGVKPGTLRSRKNREEWQRNVDEEVATQRNKIRNVATQKALQEFSDNEELNDKQKKFCILYLKYFNGSKAYREVYNCALKSAEVGASVLLSNPKVQTEIKRLKEAQMQDLYVDSLDIKREWLKQAFSDMNDYVEFGQEEYTVIDPETEEKSKRLYSFVRLKDSEEVDGTLIQEVKQGRDGVSFKLVDKQKALQELAKFFGNNDNTSGDIVILDSWSDSDE